MTDLLPLPISLLLLLMVANGAPVLVHRVMGARLSFPVDAGLRLGDGQPLFGPSKTLRGLIGALAATPLAAWLLGLEPLQGLIIAAAAMIGDLLSSFVKRRNARPPSSQALGLDQIPEAALPLLAVQPHYGLSLGMVVLLVVAFVILELVLSRLLYRLRIRNRPY